MIESPLRDLARKLRHTAREHIAYSQVVELMTLVESHLHALAFHEEAGQREGNARAECARDQEMSNAAGR